MTDRRASLAGLLLQQPHCFSEAVRAGLRSLRKAVGAATGLSCRVANG